MDTQPTSSDNGHGELPIAIAADVLPDRVEPVQATLPGVRPVFDVGAALDAIEDAASTARDAEAAYTRAHELAKDRRKIADSANTKLRDLIRDLAERRHDARYEPPTDESSGTADRDGESGEPRVLATTESGVVHDLSSENRSLGV
jgi:hypothetical protein